MRIGIFTHNYPRKHRERSDAGTFVYDFAQELSKTNDVFIFCPNYGGKKDAYDKVPVTWFNWGGPSRKFGVWSFVSPLSVYYFFKLLIVGRRKAVEFIEKNRIDYCLAAWSLPSAVFAYFVNRKLGTDYGIWSLGSDLNRYVKFPILRQLIILSLKNADNLFANSYSLVKKVNVLSGRQCQFLPAVTDISTSGARPFRLRNYNYNFLFVGRLERVKGPDLLIEACRILRSRNIAFNLNILGGGSMKQWLERKIKCYSLLGFVRLWGWADEVTVAGFMKASDALIIPSRRESLPIVLIESVRFSLPVVAASVGDCPILIKKYNIGLSYEGSNVDNLANAMIKMMNDKNFNKSNYLMGGDMLKDFSQKKAVTDFLGEIK